MQRLADTDAMEVLREREAAMTPEIRPATSADAEACGRIILGSEQELSLLTR